jgi:DNA polymerase
MRFPQEILPDVIVYFKQLERKGITSIYLSDSELGGAEFAAERENVAVEAPAATPASGSGEERPMADAARIDTVQKENFMPRVSKAEKLLAELSKAVAVCTQCSLHEKRTKAVFGVGNQRTRVMFVGEAPGRDEDLKGEPFVGRAGQLLNKILAAIDLEREDVYITNILKCRPPQNRDPQESEINRCEEYLKRQIELIEPKVVCALGRISAQWLLKTNAPLSTLRTGEYRYEGIPVLPTYHPAALLRNPAFKKPTWEDFKKLKAMLDDE